MRNLFVFIVFFYSFLYSQPRIDSVRYYTTLSENSLKSNNYKNALLYTQQAINFSKKNHNIKEQASQTYNLGKIYYDLKKYDDAIETFHKSVALFDVLKTNYKYASAYYFLGLSYIEKKNFTLAETCFNIAQKNYILLKIHDKGEMINLQKGILAKHKGDLSSALTIFRTIITKRDHENILNTKAEALYQIGEIEDLKKKYNLSLNYLNRALELNSKNNNPEQKAKILLGISTVYEKMLDKTNAYFYLKQHLNLKENLSILNNEKLGIDDYENFKESQRLREIAQVEKEKLEKEKSSKFSKLISILAIALISILSLLSLSLYKNNIIRSQSNFLLKEKNKELEIAKDNAEKASHARSEFLSTVSHELRTPLNAINGITHLLLEENPKPSQMHYLQSLKFSGNYLTTFINKILEINRIDSNKVEVEKINFDLKELLGNIQNSLVEIAQKNNNSFTLDIDDAIPDNLIGDPTKLSQIFMNLINNALKFTKNGTVRVIAKLQTLKNENANIYFEIVDTGIGIPPDKLQTVFESFSQGSIEINRKFGGTGLGLTIVKKLVKILGGQIKLRSVIDQGSSFSFKLNFKIDPSILIKEEKKTFTYDSLLLNNKKILLVEDNKINQMITKKMLANKGIKCLIIDNGEEAIEIIKEQKFDLILMDVHLPGINGTIATQKIREFDATIPIIALTAISLNENREMLLSFGMNDVITKPFIPEDFYAAIAHNIQ